MSSIFFYLLLPSSIFFIPLSGVQEFVSCRGGSAYPPENLPTHRADTLICPYNTQSLISHPITLIPNLSSLIQFSPPLEGLGEVSILKTSQLIVSKCKVTAFSVHGKLLSR
jgi:hypothetical protein